jgi:L-ribulokinase
LPKAIGNGAEGKSLSEVLMAKDKFALGIDYGTESGRVVVVRVRDGQQMGAAVISYPDGVIDERLPGGPRLEHDWALQNPADYLLVLEKAIPKALREAKVKGEDVIGIGTDFTGSTPLPVKKDGTPLCFLHAFR